MSQNPIDILKTISVQINNFANPMRIYNSIRDVSIIKHKGSYYIDTTEVFKIFDIIEKHYLKLIKYHEFNIRSTIFLQDPEDTKDDFDKFIVKCFSCDINAVLNLIKKNTFIIELLDEWLSKYYTIVPFYNLLTLIQKRIHIKNYVFAVPIALMFKFGFTFTDAFKLAVAGHSSINELFYGADFIYDTWKIQEDIEKYFDLSLKKMLLIIDILDIDYSNSFKETFGKELHTIPVLKKAFDARVNLPVYKIIESMVNYTYYDLVTNFDISECTYFIWKYNVKQNKCYATIHFKGSRRVDDLVLH
jgi:hypothetical protein